MKFGTYLAIYFLIWWLTLFAVLPWGVRNQEEAGDVVPGSDPARPRCIACGASCSGPRRSRAWCMGFCTSPMTAG